MVEKETLYPRRKSEWFSLWWRYLSVWWCGLERHCPQWLVVNWTSLWRKWTSAFSHYSRILCKRQANDFDHREKDHQLLRKTSLPKDYAFGYCIQGLEQTFPFSDLWRPQWLDLRSHLERGFERHLPLQCLEKRVDSSGHVWSNAVFTLVPLLHTELWRKRRHRRLPSIWWSELEELLQISGVSVLDTQSMVPKTQWRLGGRGGWKDPDAHERSQTKDWANQGNSAR